MICFNSQVWETSVYRYISHVGRSNSKVIKIYIHLNACTLKLIDKSMRIYFPFIPIKFFDYRNSISFIKTFVCEYYIDPYPPTQHTFIESSKWCNEFIGIYK